MSADSTSGEGALPVCALNRHIPAAMAATDSSCIHTRRAHGASGGLFHYEVPDGSSAPRTMFVWWISSIDARWPCMQVTCKLLSRCCYHPSTPVLLCACCMMRISLDVPAACAPAQVVSGSRPGLTGAARPQQQPTPAPWPLGLLTPWIRALLLHTHIPPPG